MEEVGAGNEAAAGGEERLEQGVQFAVLTGRTITALIVIQAFHLFKSYFSSRVVQCGGVNLPDCAV